MSFLNWVRDVYDPERLEKKFKENKFIEKFLTKIFEENNSN